MQRYIIDHPFMGLIVRLRNRLLATLYFLFLHSIFFHVDLEKLHTKLSAVWGAFGRSSAGRSILRMLFSFGHSRLRQTLHGIVFPNPVGLAAGFDKDAKLIYGVAASGFGYEEAGSVSAQPSDGNAKPRLWWMKKTKATLVYSGLHNDGAAAIAKRLHGKRFFVPLGISIAKTNSPDTVTTEAGIQDYVATMRTFRNIGDYFAVNISCPNAYGGQPFHSRETLSELLKQLDTIQTDKPIFIKVSPDLSNEEFDGVIDVALEYGVQGLICGNSTKKHNPDAVREEFPSENGGMGGVPVADISDRQVAYAYKKCKDQLTIIGCGGIFTAEDAYRKIKLGASLVQVATGVFFEGPTLSSSINEGLIRLLKRDGYASITEAIGVDNHT